MGIRLVKEDIIYGEILNGKKQYYIIEKNKIGRLRIGNINDYPCFYAYDNRYENNHDDLIVLEIEHQAGYYYFKPLFSGDKILICSEDYMWGDCFEAPLGEVKISNNRTETFRKRSGNVSYKNFNKSYVAEQRELVTENPLCVRLVDLIKLDELKSSNRVFLYNEMCGQILAKELMYMKIKSQNELLSDYQLLEQRTSKTLSKKPQSK